MLAQQPQQQPAPGADAEQLADALGRLGLAGDDQPAPEVDVDPASLPPELLARARRLAVLLDHRARQLGRPLVPLPTLLRWIRAADDLGRVDFLNALLGKLADAGAPGIQLQPGSVPPAGAYPSVTQARKALRGVHISLWDVLDGRLDRIHPSVQTLRRALKRRKDWFPREVAKELGLRDLLREMF